MNLCNPGVIKEVMARAGITFRREFGQNFLIDRSVPEQIAELCADDENSLILEVGPGVGSLTQELALRYRQVCAVEIDSGLIPVLAETLSEYNNISVVNEDVMKVDLHALLEKELGEPLHDGQNISVCANLPYYITTPILMRLLECGIPFKTITIMIQKEVADRLVASPGTADYGAITAVLAFYGKAKRLFHVPHSAFLPAPKVDSTVIRIDLYGEPPFHVEDRAFFFGVLHAAFEMRRKTLVNAVSAKYRNLNKDIIAKTLEEMGLDPLVRGERLSATEFAELSNRLYQYM